MADVDDIIEYLKTLRKGFDKDLFQSKIDELAYNVDSTGLAYDDFHTLFQVWLNISLPATKWASLGSCLAPSEKMEKRTLDYALGWILANHARHKYTVQVGFLLDWITVAMDCDCIDMTVLDTGYEVFYTMLTYENLAAHAVKLVYTLTKPVDVTRQRVLELLGYARLREANKSTYKQLQVLLGLFKSYKPDCVPEDIPAYPIYTAFRKTNEQMTNRFRKIQEKRNKFSNGRQNLTWINPVNSQKGRNKKVEPLVPNLEFINTGRHSEDGDNITKTNFLDFSEPSALVQHSLYHGISRPARLRSLLCNATGQTLLALHSHPQQAFLSHDLHHLLYNCFLESSPYSYTEKADLLQKLNMFQRTLLQGIPVITKFLAEYLPFWNEKDYFPEILELTEWVSAECGHHVVQIADSLRAVFLRASALEQCAIHRTLANMYVNLVYSSTKPRQHFLSAAPLPSAKYSELLPAVAAIISNMSHKGLQTDPDDIRSQYMWSWSALVRARAELAGGACVGALPSALCLALPILGASPVLIDNVAKLVILYKKIMTKTKGDPMHIETITKYLQDVLNCLYSEECLSKRDGGLIFHRMQPQLVEKLCCLVPDADAKFSIRNHFAFAPYTYIRLRDVGHSAVDNKMLFHGAIEPEFPQLGLLMKKTLSDLRHY